VRDRDTSFAFAFRQAGIAIFRTTMALGNHCKLTKLEEIRVKDGNLSIPLYVVPAANGELGDRSAADNASFPTALAAWLESSRKERVSLHTLIGKT